MLIHLALFFHLKDEMIGFSAFIWHIFMDLHFGKLFAVCQGYHNDLVLALQEDAQSGRRGAVE